MFLEPVVNALTYAADNGIDVVNMSFYIDPWLYNCTTNPADSPEAQAEQRAIIAAVNRALNYAYDHGVTLVGSLGNNHEDLGTRDRRQQPRLPTRHGVPAPIDNATCVDLPIEGPHVIGVSALGPSTAKADYSNYGVEQISVSAPGGTSGLLRHAALPRNANQVLSTYPKTRLQQLGRVDPTGNVTPAGVAAGTIRDCNAAGVCGYYQYLQGTSMASPHATGCGRADREPVRQARPETCRSALEPAKVESLLLRTAAEHACPKPRLYSYANVGRPPGVRRALRGRSQFNGFYGYGIVDAFAAVTRPPRGTNSP